MKNCSPQTCWLPWKIGYSAFPHLLKLELVEVYVRIQFWIDAMLYILGIHLLTITYISINLSSTSEQTIISNDPILESSQAIYVKRKNPTVKKWLLPPPSILSDRYWSARKIRFVSVPSKMIYSFSILPLYWLYILYRREVLFFPFIAIIMPQSHCGEY